MTGKRKNLDASRSKSVLFTKETYLEWFKSMTLMRRFEEKAGQLYGGMGNRHQS